MRVFVGRDGRSAERPLSTTTLSLSLSLFARGIDVSVSISNVISSLFFYSITISDLDLFCWGDGGSADEGVCWARRAKRGASPLHYYTLSLSLLGV